MGGRLSQQKGDKTHKSNSGLFVRCLGRAWGQCPGVLQVGVLVRDGGGDSKSGAEAGTRQKCWGLVLALGWKEGRQAHQRETTRTKGRFRVQRDVESNPG